MRTLAMLLMLSLAFTFGCAPKHGEIVVQSSSADSDSKTVSEPEVTTETPVDTDSELKFLVFADFHYKKKMYASSIEDIDELFKRAADNDVDFVIHLGDFCNDYIGSPELFDAYLDNEYGIPVFGVIGNHDLESGGNTMKVVIPKLTNQSVTFGEGEDIGYWYTDIKDFRLVGLDTNYSLDANGKWMHNLSGSHGAPSNNTMKESLSPTQIQWLEGVVSDASEKGLKVLVFSHGAVAGKWYSAPDSAEVRAIFNKYPETVLLVSNGHLHTDRFEIIDNIAYFDVNACINAYWKSSSTHHYSDDHTFMFTNYIAGEPQEPEVMKLKDLSQGRNTWFLEDPISALVTVKTDGYVEIRGSISSWRYGIRPPVTSAVVRARITDRTIKLNWSDEE